MAARKGALYYGLEQAYRRIRSVSSKLMSLRRRSYSWVVRVDAWFAIAAAFSTRAAIFEISGDAGRPKRVIANFCVDTGRDRSPTYHKIHVGPSRV